LKDNPDAAGEIEVKLREALGLLPETSDTTPEEQGAGGVAENDD